MGVLKSWQEVSQDLPLTKARCSEKELATINSGTYTRRARNGAPNTCRIPLSCSQATSSQQTAALPGVNHQPKTTMVLGTPEGGFYIFYTSCFIHSLQPTYSAPHEGTPICPNFYPSPKISIFPYWVCVHSSSRCRLLSLILLVSGIRHDTKHGRVCHFNSSFVISWSLLNQSFMEGYFRSKCRGSRRRKVRNHPWFNFDNIGRE